MQFTAPPIGLFSGLFWKQELYSGTFLDTLDLRAMYLYFMGTN